MKHSIRIKLAVIIVGLTAGTLLMCWFINNTFLEDYYMMTKKPILISAYRTVNKENINVDMNVNDVPVEILRLCEGSGISLVVMDPGRQIALSTTGNNNSLVMHLTEYLIGQGDQDDIIDKTDHYTLQTTYDDIMHSNYMEIWGTLDSGNYFLMRMPIESIQESVAISNQFYGYIGIIAAILSSVIILIISKQFTKPILQLAHISEKMSNLDFNVKYKGKAKDEIGVLGSSINKLSEKLEKNISDLKTANNELKNDIEKKIQIDEMRKEFLSNVSHELKTPIALIQGYAEGLKESVNDDEESRDFYCEVIMDEANKMNKMVKKLLTLNQIEFGNQQLAFERFDIISLIQGVINSSSILMKQKEVELIFPYENPIFVWADEFQIEEVITNYISNALNHVNDDKMIKITVERVDKNVMVTVYNSGNPIPDEELNNIWIKFYKVDKARTREYGGSGIGLSIVKAIMDSLHKSFGVRNMDKGVEFWFEVDAENEVER